MAGRNGPAGAVAPGGARSPRIRIPWRQIGAILALWRRRAAGRRMLARFDQHQLRDIGLSPAEAWQEARKRFWQV